MDLTGNILIKNLTGNISNKKLTGNLTGLSPIIGGQVYWGTILGTLSGQTDLQTCLNGKLSVLNFNSYSGVTNLKLSHFITGVTWTNVSGKPILFSGIYADLTSKPSLFDGVYSSLTSKPNLSVYLTGLTWTQLSGKPTLFDGVYSSLTSKPNLSVYLTGVTWTQISSKPTLFSGNTFSASGGTKLKLTGNNLTIYSITGTSNAGGTACWGGITGTLSSQTDLQAALNSKLASGATAICATNSINSTKLNNHNDTYFLSTGSTIAYATTAGAAPASDVSTWAKCATKPAYTAVEVSALSTSNFNTFSGTTLPANYYSKTQINTYTGATNTLIGNRLLTSSFNTYSGNTNTAIGLKLAKTDFNTYTNATNTLISNRLLTSNFNTFTGTTLGSLYYNKTQINSYSGNTASAIGLKLNSSAISAWALAGTKPSYTASEVSALSISNFNTFSGTTLPSLYYNKTQINSYSGATNTLIGNRLLTSSFNTYSGATLTNINSRLLASSISSWALAGTKPSYTSSEVGAESTTSFN